MKSGSIPSLKVRFRTPSLQALCALLVWAAVSHAQISPGKLTTAHQSLEGITNCTSCHELGEAVDAGKCYICHTALARRVGAGEGYHAGAEVRGKNCSVCHSEHHGRDYQLIFWPSGQDQFDHALSGWELTGRHTGLACEICHQPRFQQVSMFGGNNSLDSRSTKLGLERSCTSCHEDEHGEQLSDDCLKCHNETDWVPAPGFDHNRDTRYILTGRHSGLSCGKCHELQARPHVPENLIVYAGSPEAFARYGNLSYGSCSGCHTDPHQGRFGAECARCHTTESFAATSVSEGEFDHDRTNYRLRGMHEAVACLSCHTGGKLTDSMAHGACRDCHKDEHRGQFAGRADGGACDACHSLDRPFLRHTYTVEAHGRTDYPLTGSHRAIPCSLCHTPVAAEGGADYARFEFSDLRCEGCHDDIHRGQLDIWIEKNGCEFCHTADTWHKTSFNHDLARFALEGGHRGIPCLRCHWIETDEGEKLVWMKPLDRTCAGCHDDAHAGQFVSEGGAVDCQKCHTAAGWRTLLFDHARDTDFPLSGGHENVACASCHMVQTVNGQEVVEYTGVSRECSACHGGRPIRPGRG